MGCRRTLWVAFWMIACFGVLLPVLTGCALLNSFLDPTKVGQFRFEYAERGIRRVLTPRDAPLGPANAAEPTPDDLVPVYADYRLAPGDTLALIAQDLAGPGIPEQVALEISSTGNVRVPQLGSVKAAGLTELELENELTARFREADILPDPDVRVYTQTKRRRVFTIRGAVGVPGQYPIADPDTRLLDVIGLVSDIAGNVTKFYVIRRAGGGVDVGEVEPYVEPRGPEGLVIPPPADEGDFEVDFSTTVGLGDQQREPPAEPPADQERAELEAVIAPPEPPAPATRTAEAAPPFEPLVFDPQTGELIEAQAVPERREGVPGAERADTDFDEEEFDWEEVPELELEQRVIEIDTRALFGGDPRFNIVIRDRDVINVPIDTGLYYLMGEVARPGAYAFNGRDITIKQALASGGGFTPFAWPQRCEIIRHEPGTDKQLTIPVNLDGIFAGLEDDVYLRDDDIINVGTHFVAPFLFVIRNSFRFTYGFGFVYDRNFADKDAYGAQLNPQIRADQQRAARGLPF